LFGFLGVLLALPVAAVVMVVLRFLHARYTESSLYADAAGSAGKRLHRQLATHAQAEQSAKPAPALDASGSPDTPHPPRRRRRRGPRGGGSQPA
jgi:hypothetical protein